MKDLAGRTAVITGGASGIGRQAYLFSPGSETSRWAFNWDLKGFHPNTSLSEYIFWSRAWLER